MYQPRFFMFFPILYAHISGAKFQYPDLIGKVLCGQIDILMAKIANPALCFNNFVLYFNNPALLTHKAGLSLSLQQSSVVT